MSMWGDENWSDEKQTMNNFEGSEPPTKRQKGENANEACSGDVAAAAPSARMAQGAIERAPPLPMPTPPYPAFSYRIQAAQQHLYPPRDVVRTIHTYDYTDEEADLTPLRAVDSGQPAAAAPAPAPAAPVPEDAPVLDAVAMPRELELGFNLHDDQDVIDQLEIMRNPGLLEYGGNGAAFQSDFFERGLGALPMGDLQHEAFAPFMENDAPRSVAGFAPDYAFVSEADDDEQPGPSRPRAHAVQLYPGDGEGQPHTCLVAIPKLVVEKRSPAEAGVSGVSQSGPMPLQAKPVPSPNHSENILAQLLGPADDEDNLESNKENEPDTLSEALRSAYSAFADLDAQATESDQMEADTASSPTSWPALWESNDSAAVAGTSAPPAEVDKPAAEVDEPAAEVDEPAAEVDEPAAEVDEPAAEVDEPAAEVDEPAAEVDEPAAEVDEPAAEVDEPAAEVDEPAAEVVILVEADTSTGMNAPPSTTDSVAEDIEPYPKYNPMFQDPRTMSDGSLCDAYEVSERATDETPADTQDEPNECTPVDGPSNRSTEPPTDNGLTYAKPPSKRSHSMVLRSHKR